MFICYLDCSYVVIIAWRSLKRLLNNIGSSLSYVTLHTVQHYA